VHTARFRVLVQPPTRWKKEEVVLFVAERLAAAAYAALADGVVERARMGALDLRQGASDLTSGGIDGLMDDHENGGGRL
jgi:hypothetical protein